MDWHTPAPIHLGPVVACTQRRQQTISSNKNSSFWFRPFFLLKFPCYDIERPQPKAKRWRLCCRLSFFFFFFTRRSRSGGSSSRPHFNTNAPLVKCVQYILLGAASEMHKQRFLGLGKSANRLAPFQVKSIQLKFSEFSSIKILKNQILKFRN